MSNLVVTHLYPLSHLHWPSSMQCIFSVYHITPLTFQEPSHNKWSVINFQLGFALAMPAFDAFKREMIGNSRLAIGPEKSYIILTKVSSTDSKLKTHAFPITMQIFIVLSLFAGQSNSSFMYSLFSVFPLSHRCTSLIFSCACFSEIETFIHIAVMLPTEISGIPKKFAMAKRWQTSTNLDLVHNFPCLASRYRRFVLNSSNSYSLDITRQEICSGPLGS